MQVSFNPYSQKCKPNFQALTPAQIAEHTKNTHTAEMFKTDVARGAIQLDQDDMQKLASLATELKAKGKKFVAFILDDVVQGHKD